MAKVCFLLAVLCGLASINVTFAEPSITYAAAPPAKYPAPAAPATYPAAPPKYEAPAPPPATYPAAPAKYEAPAPPAPAKYEAEKPKYEEIKKEEYKTVEKPVEYKKEEKMPGYGGGKKYRRSINDDKEEEIQSDPFNGNTSPRQIPLNVLNVVRDAVIMKLLSENDPLYGVSGSKSIRSKIRGDPFSMMNDPRRGGIVGAIGNALSSFFNDDSYSMMNDPGWLGGIANAVGNILNRIWRDESARRNLGLTRKQAKVFRDAVIVAAENDPGFGKKFGQAFAKKSAGSFSDWKYRGGDPFSVTVQDLVQMYGRDPYKGYWP